MELNKMKKTIQSPVGLINPVCDCGTNEWKDTSAFLGFEKIMQCSECGANKVCGEE